MSAEFDAIVIGAGHNGLTCACYLAKAGLQVIVLEQGTAVGGMTGTAEITLPGYWSDTHAICIQFANFSPVPRELDLASHGYELLHPDPCLVHAFPDGRCLCVHRDVDDTCRSIARFSAKDADTWRRLYEQFLPVKDAIFDSFNRPPQDFATVARELQSEPHGMDQYRFQMQTLRSWSREIFEAEETRLLAGTWAVHAGVAPDDTGGGNLVWLFSMVVQHFGNNVVRGGMRNLPLALESVLRQHGGQVRTGAPVKQILVDSGRASGVELQNGEVVSTRQLVASSVHPQQLALDLLGEPVVGAEIANKVRRYEPGEPVMIVYLALDRPPEFKAGALAGQSVYVHPSPPTLDYFSSVFQQSRAGFLPENPFYLMCHDSAADPERVPAGRSLMKLVVQPVPYQIQGDAAGRIRETGWNVVKETWADHIIERISQDYIPALADRILSRVVHSPVDLEQLLPSAVMGTNTHGAFVPYQIGSMRPIPEMGNYRSPVSNVFLCGSGSHPGPGVTMAPGRNAAQTICQDLGLELNFSS